MVTPGLEFVALFFSLFKAGIIPVLIDPGIGLKPLKHCLAEAAPEAFIGVTRAQAARMVLGWARASIRKTVTVGPRPAWSGINMQQLLHLGHRTSGSMLEKTGPDDMAAILFTSGSTGIPKGVVYRHRHFAHQVEMLQRAFRIEAGETDLATFPPFALFDPALGMATVVPEMDPTRPARARPEYLIQAHRTIWRQQYFRLAGLAECVVAAHHGRQHRPAHRETRDIRRRRRADSHAAQNARGLAGRRCSAHTLWRHRVPAGGQYFQR